VRVVHLAAQAGVRYSIENPFAYERSNLAGHLSVMEACRHADVRCYSGRRRRRCLARRCPLHRRRAAVPCAW
jgi:dTDP-D-glucose 4,6-dehydratase